MSLTALAQIEKITLGFGLQKISLPTLRAQSLLAICRS